MKKIALICAAMFVIYTACSEKKSKAVSDKKQDTVAQAPKESENQVITGQDVNPDTTKVFDHIPIINKSKPQSGKPINAFDKIVFQGKGSDDRKEGMRLASTGDLKGAIDLFTKSISKEANNPDAYFYRGKARAQLKDLKGLKLIL